MDDEDPLSDETFLEDQIVRSIIDLSNCSSRRGKIVYESRSWPRFAKLIGEQRQSNGI